jgi:hypothetical protein
VKRPEEPVGGPTPEWIALRAPAITVAEATERYPGQVDPNWRAVTVNHGRPDEWAWGTVAENSTAFAACSAVLGLGVGGFIFCAYRSRRAAGACPVEAVSSMARTIQGRTLSGDENS